EIRLARRADYRKTGRRRSWPPLCRDLLLCLRRAGFSRKRARAALLAHRHRADDALLHARSGALRRSAIAAPRRLPGVKDYRGSVPHEIDPAQLLAESGARFDRGREIVFAENVGIDR